MKEFDPVTHVENSGLILDHGEWPNFHDAEVLYLNMWRGDIRPDDNVWIGPIIEASFELCALKKPYIVGLKFHDCNSIRMEEFNHQNAVYDLRFKFEARGTYTDGTPLPPHILVSFEQAFGVALSFTCFRVEAIERRQPANHENG
ncbi:hypothetical protein D3OALGA1CA_1251 [Olavius algarvensis associated proteobacterium Delta 3]|nr:hypothetical protein D3OALGA1CA_1251 [Olavius algarvensis associated proteobacterium Delta 3]CAB5102728.1 hypothetical protein D3OALGB2SA_1936 [Olavius algarvensis associated proteobacterium Delta 3]